MKVLNPMSGFPTRGSNKGTGNPQGIWPWRPVGFYNRLSRGLRETGILVLENTNKILCALRPRGEEQWPHRRLNPNYLLVLEGLLWISRGSPQGRGHREVPLGVNPLAVCINPTIEPVHPRIGATQAEQLPGRECNPTNQQIIGLKLYWARPCPPEQDPVFLITSPSHQEAYTSLLASSIRGQKKEVRRSTVSQWLKQKPHYRMLIIRKKAESYVSDEGTR